MNSSVEHGRASRLFFNLLPVYKHERTRFFILCCLKGLLSCLFIMLKIQKKNNIVIGDSEKQVAAVKSFVFPMTLLLITIYTALGTRFSQRRLFYGVIFFFLGLFVVCAVLLPYAKWLTPDASGALEVWKGYPLVESLLKVYQNWIKALFYCLAELYGQFFIILLFWGIANDIFTREQAKRIYHLFIAAGCLGSMVGCGILVGISQYVHQGYGSELTKEEQNSILDKESQYVLLCGIVIILLVLMLYSFVLSQPNGLLTTKQVGGDKRKERMSFGESVRYIVSNRYLLGTTLLVISCAVTTSLVGITYSHYVKHNTFNDSNFVLWKAKETLWSSVPSVLAGFFLTHWVSRKFSWRTNAYISPVIIMLMGVVFFGLSSLNYHYGVDGLCQRYFGRSSYQVIGAFGFFQEIMSIFVKYVFFDSTKEIVFVSLETQARRKGKGAVDVVGSRMGKGLSSYIHIIVMSLFGVGSQVSIGRVSHVLLVIFMVFCFLWFLSVHYLAGKVEAKQEDEKSR